MTKISQLPLTVELTIGESAMSLASRLARRNGVPRMLTFCSDLGLDHKALANGNDNEINRLSSVAGCDPKAVSFWTPKFGDDGYFQLGEEKLKFTSFDRTRARACPHCISKSRERHGETGPFHLGIWQLYSVRTCHRHQCMLVDLPEPKNRSDNFDYSQILEQRISETTASVRRDDQSLERWLLARLENGPANSWLDSLPLHVATQLCENFGFLVAFGPEIPRSKITVEQWLKAGCKGFDILQHGPKTLTDTLKMIQLQSPVDVKQYRERYGIFFKWLRDRNKDPAFDDIRNLVRPFIWSNFPVPEGGVVLGEVCPRQHVFTPRTAQKKFGISRWKFEQRLIETGFAPKPPDGSRPVLPDYPSLERIEQIVRDIEKLRDAKSTASFLGIERGTLLILVKAGIFQVELKLDTKAPYYDSRKVSAFLAQLRKQCIKCDGSIDAGTEPFSKVAVRSRWGLGELLKFILSERLTLHAANPKTAKFHEFRVSFPVVKKAMVQQQGAFCSLSDAAKILEIDTKTVSALISLGFIDTVSRSPQETRQRWQIVSKKSVSEFDRKYISLKKLGLLREESIQYMTKELIKARYLPLPLGRKTQRIFRRSDVLK